MELSTRTVTLELAETFVIARESTDAAEVVEVEIRHDGVAGFGEAAPIDRYDESAGVGARVARGRTPRCSATIRSRSTRSTRGCRSPASRRRAARSTPRCTTSQGKLLGVPVWRLLGLRRDGPPTSWTIWLGDPDDMARRAEARRAAASGG